MSTIESTMQFPNTPSEEGVLAPVGESLHRLGLIPDAETDDTEAQTLSAHSEESDPQEPTLHLATTTEDSIARRSIDRVSALFHQKAEEFRRISRRAGTVAAASLFIAGGAAVAQEITDKVPHATAAEVDYGTGGYPWANLTPGTGEVDGNGHPIRECGAWVAWRLQATGRDPSRALNSRLTGEVIDNVPAIGAAADTADGRHTMYVEDLTDTHITISDYNGSGGPYKYGVQTYERTHPEVQTWTFTHFELPDPRGAQAKEGTGETPTNDADIYANLKKLNRNVITSKQPVREGSFLESENGQYRLVIGKGDVKLRDTKSDDQVKWSAKTNKQASQLQVRLGKGKQKGKNALTFGDGKKDYRKWNIGTATKVEVGADGKLAGYKGKNQVWEANSIAGVPRVAKLSMKKITTNRSTKSSRR